MWLVDAGQKGAKAEIVSEGFGESFFSGAPTPTAALPRATIEMAEGSDHREPGGPIQI